MGIEYKVIGRHIRAARKRMHMTQEDVAAAIEMSPAHFGRWNVEIARSISSVSRSSARC